MGFEIKMNGKNIKPGDFGKELEKMVAGVVKSRVKEKFETIRNPETGEFPTVVASGDSLKELSWKVEGSKELLENVIARSELYSKASEENPATLIRPHVFLCYGTEDQKIAEHIAQGLHSKGIEVWWDNWCIAAGDSLTSKIDAGLAECTHFIALLTPTSITKPWVQHEMDKALLNKLEQKCKFIALRYNLTPTEVPSQFKDIYCPAIESENFDTTQLGNDILGVTRKPALQPISNLIATAAQAQTGYTPAATAIAKYCVENSPNGEFADLQLQLPELASATGLTIDDIKDALYELSNYMQTSFDRVIVKKNLYPEFDKYWMPWNPQEDALKLATDIVNIDELPAEPAKIDEIYGWGPRRLNSAMGYLMERDVVRVLEAFGASPYIVVRIVGNDATRRFVKSRSL